MCAGGKMKTQKLGPEDRAEHESTPDDKRESFTLRAVIWTKNTSCASGSEREKNEMGGAEPQKTYSRKRWQQRILCAQASSAKRN
jgi:hypothetical protein